MTFSLIGSAQTKYLNQVKYWKYRQDFKERFVYMGEGNSKSLPIIYRRERDKLITYGDATLELGWYMGMLATEYHISSKKMYLPVTEYEGNDPAQTLVELYYALRCFDRLDEKAEPFYDETAEGELNGFFIRDDADYNIREKFKEVEILWSGFRKHIEQEVVCCEPSQDQIYHLLLGMSLVKKYVPKGTKVKGVDLNELATEQALRMLNYLRKYNWIIKNPVRKKPNGKLMNTRIGFNARPFAKGIKRIYYTFAPDPKEKVKTPFFSGLFWSTMRSKLHPVYWHNDNRHMSLTVAALGNGFKRNTYNKLRKVSKNNEWYIYPLINALLFPNNRMSKINEVMERCEEILNVAPENGIHGTFDVKVEHEWTTNNYFIRERNFRQYGRHYTENNNYNGLDLLLFYNIWFIHRTGI